SELGADRENLLEGAANIKPVNGCDEREHVSREVAPVALHRDLSVALMHRAGSRGLRVDGAQHEAVRGTALLNLQPEFRAHLARVAQRAPHVAGEFVAHQAQSSTAP